MAALKRMSVPTVRVRRDGRVQEISSRDLVPGDVVLLETGNVVPADGRVLESVNLRAQEAALTGESEAVEKDGAIVFAAERPLAERRNMVYAGTVVTYGRGEVVVTATGMATELGKIADLIQSVEKEKTPLQKRLDRLGKGLAIAAGVLVVVVFLLGIRTAGTREQVFEVLLTAVSLAVAAIPEAMTAVVTIALSLGAQRMLKRRALIRKLPAVETLGSVSVICSDKTGTLTQNRMTVTAIDIANRRIDLVQKEDGGRFTLGRVASAEVEGALAATLDLLLVGGALCNDAILEREEDPAAGHHAVGDPTEARSGPGRGGVRGPQGRPRQGPAASGRAAVRLRAEADDDDPSDAGGGDGRPRFAPAALGPEEPGPRCARLPRRDEGGRRRAPGPDQPHPGRRGARPDRRRRAPPRDGGKRRPRGEGDARPGPGGSPARPSSGRAGAGRARDRPDLRRSLRHGRPGPPRGQRCRGPLPCGGHPPRHDHG